MPPLNSEPKQAGETRTNAGGSAAGAEPAAETSAPTATPRAADAAAGAPPSSARERILQSFAGPCRTVVTFALYRSAARGKGTRVPGHLPEKRLFEVEALEHNTLQQVMGETGAVVCATREEQRAGGRAVCWSRGCRCANDVVGADTVAVFVIFIVTI